MTDDLAILIDGRALRLYGLGHRTFEGGGTELMIDVLAHGLAERGHTVHVITPDLPHEEQRGPREWWWPEAYHPKMADVVLAAHSLETIGDLTAPLLVLLSNTVDAPLFGRESLLDAVACFTEYHKTALCERSPILPDICHVTGLGVDASRYRQPVLPPGHCQPHSAEAIKAYRAVPGRMLFANSPDRGLWHMLDIFDAVKKAVPEASLHVTYDFARTFEAHRWHATAMAERLWDCKRRLETTPGVVNRGGLSAAEMLTEQMECQVHVMPSDPPNTGSQLHGLTQLELAAAGVPLVLADMEAFPELYADCATLLPLPGEPAKYDAGRQMMGRVDAQDWADVVIELMKSAKKWKAASKASRAVAERHTWPGMVERFQTLLDGLMAGLAERQQEAA